MVKSRTTNNIIFCPPEENKIFNVAKSALRIFPNKKNISVLVYWYKPKVMMEYYEEYNSKKKLIKKKYKIGKRSVKIIIDKDC